MKLRLAIGVIAALATALPPVMVKAQELPYGTARMPKTCTSKLEPRKGAPSVAQARMYFTCDSETQDGKVGTGTTSSYLRLTDNLTMQVAPTSRPANNTDLQYNLSYGGSLGMDTDQPVYDIRGSYDGYVCFDTTRNKRIHPIGGNCNASRYTSTGICFRNTFKEWHCMMKGSAKSMGDKLPPPQI